MKPPAPGKEGALQGHPSHQHPMRNAAFTVALLVRLAAVLTAAIGVIVFAGWVFGLPLLKSVLPGVVEMKANTAVGLVLAGYALFFLGDRPSLPLQRLAQALALAVGALGLATLGEYLFGWQLGIDELLFRDTAGAYNVIRGRMSPYSAVAFASIGLALTALPRPSLRPLVWSAAIVMTAIGALSFLGYLWNASELITDRLLPPVAVNTAVAFILLGAGTLLATRRPETQQGRRPIALAPVEMKILAGFIGALLLLSVGGGFTYRAAAQFTESARLVSHTQEMRTTLSHLDGIISDAESAQRNYLITGQRQQLDNYTRLTAKIKGQQEAIAHLVADDPDQSRNLAELRGLIAQVIDLLGRGITLYQQQGFPAARELVASGQSFQVMQAILTVTERMDAVEKKLLAEREVALTHDRQRTLNWLLLTLLVATCVFVILYRGIRREMLARNEAEQALVAAERRLLDMTDSVPGAIYQLRSYPDASHRFEYLSKGVEQLRGVDREAALRDFSFMWDTVLDEDKPAMSAIMAKAVQSRGLTQYDFRVKQPDGALKWLRASASLRKESDGSVLWNGYWADITDQKRLELALQVSKVAADTANRAKSTFLATMSHEIRTPMNGVLGMLELLSLTKLDREQRTTLEIVRESGKSLLRIIDDILDFSKIEAGKLEVRPEVASIKEAIEGVCKLFTGSASSKGLLITCSHDRQISPAVLVDPVRLRQILNNLVSNALKFTSQGSIVVTAELIERADGEDRVRFSVKDTGIGISAENQQRLFQPFSQAEDDTTHHYGGTGLGLTICRRLAGMMGGSIEMVSELGKGTTMILSLSLPIADPKDLPKTAPKSTRDLLNATTNMRRLAPSVAQAETEGTLVLVVDDHPTNRALLCRQIKTLGYAGESAENGLEALDQWKSGRFGIVITDCNMPEMDGYELARRIRTLESANGGKRTPIIACTANALGGEAEICFAAGMDDYLAKPAELTELLKKLDQWLPIPEARAGAAAPVDRSVLAAISGGDAAAERDILIDFRRVNDEDAAMLKQAVSNTDIPQVTRATHRIKGASRMVGALGLAGVCERIENASRANDWTTVKAGMGAFHQEWIRLNAYFDSL
ncbi:MAG: ATP-binding protein [Pseudomonadota bacterium]